MKKLVLIVDDDPGILEVTKIIVEEKGCLVTALGTAENLYETVEKSQPQLILLDILLSDGDGIEVCQKLKKNVKTRTIPIILMSADMQIQEKYKAAGADGFLKKPFDITELEALVKKYTSSTS